MSEVMRQSGWEKWHDWHMRVMAPTSRWFCEAVAAGPGMRVLDAACGTGIPSLELAERVRPGGKVIATDVSAIMVAAARRKAAAAGLGPDTIEHREMDLAALDFPDGSFDAVTCKDGLMFCPVPAQGAAELRRVLRPGGRFAVTVWDEPSRNPFFTTMFETVSRFVPKPPPDPRAPGPFRLSRPGDLESVLREGGFSDVSVESREVVFAYDSVEQHFEAVSDMAAPIEAAVKSLSPAELARFKGALADALAPHLVGGALRITNHALCASGSR